MNDIVSLLATDLAVAVVALSAAAVPSFRTKDGSYIDGLWGMGFVLVAVAALLQTDGDGARSALLVGLTVLWGVRISAYLFPRWLRNGPDARYQTMLGERPSALSLWLRVFVLQAVVLWLVSLPVQLGQLDKGGLTALNVVGVVIALAGIATEATADAQLAAFKKDPANHGLVMDRGLWGWSRHPNYFGEAVTWWGIALVAVHDGTSAFGFLGALVITLFLLTRSGIGPLEAQQKQTKPKYVDYIARTSAFVPRPPRPATKA